MDYFGQIIIFLSALVALKGETWNNKNCGLKKITITGYLIILFALIGLFISFVNTHSASCENEINKKIIRNTEANTEMAKNELAKANNQIDTVNKKLIIVNSKLEIYQEIVNQIKTQSDRQDQTVMMEFVQLKPHQVWVSPSFIYSGSLIEFLGFDKGLIMEYDRKKVIIPEWDGHAIQTAIMGENGKGFFIKLYNEGYKTIMGKVHVISSPRVRSKDWSWIEEKLKKSK